MRKILAVLILVLSACSVEKRGAPGTNPNTEIDIGGQTENDSVEVIISAPRAAAVGDRVPVSIVVQNNRDRHVNLSLTGREIVFDIIVATSDSTVVWSRLGNAPVQQILQLKTLAPGESFTLYDYWHTTQPGTYFIGARLPTDAQPIVAEPVAITIR